MTDVILFESFCLISLLAIRIGSALRLVPFFGGKPMPIIPWLSLTIVLAIFMAPMTGSIPSVAFGSLAWLALASKELFIGVFLGIMTRIAFSVLELAGSFVSISRTSINEAGGDIGETQISSAYVLLASTIFLLLNGHHAVISSLFGTVECLPPGALAGPSEHALSTFEPALKLFTSAMGTAVLVSIPVFAAGICADIILGMLSRIAPSTGIGGGTQSARNIAVQLAAVATLGVVVSVAVDFLLTAMSTFDLCRT